MQVSSASNSSPANTAFSLQSTATRGNVDRTVTAVGPRANPQEYVAPKPPTPTQPQINVDAATEKKLSRIQDLQVTFEAARSIVDSIDREYLLEPIM